MGNIGDGSDVITLSKTDEHQIQIALFDLEREKGNCLKVLFANSYSYGTFC